MASKVSTLSKIQERALEKSLVSATTDALKNVEVILGDY